MTFLGLMAASVGAWRSLPSDDRPPELILCGEGCRKCYPHLPYRRHTSGGPSPLRHWRVSEQLEMANSRGGRIMNRIIAILGCGFTVAACSMPINFLSLSPPTEVVRFDSKPPGAEVKTSSGQSCRTPCELSLQVAPEVSAEFVLKGYQSQTVSARSEKPQWFGSAHLAPNPIYAELRRSPVASAVEKPAKKKRTVAAASVNSSVASPRSAAPPSSANAEPTSSNSTEAEAAAPATNFAGPDTPPARQ